MNLYLVRHGETAYNRDGLGLGRADVPLTIRGEAQSAALGRRLTPEHVARVFTSPLQRARRMAAAVAGERGIAVEPRDALIEMDVGQTEGLTFADMRERHADFMRAWAGRDNLSVRMPGGESLEDVAARLRPFLAELRQLETPGAVVVVSHNFVTKLLLCELLDVPLASFRAFSIDVASLCWLQVRNRRISVKALNDCCHLDSLNIDVNPRSL